ncbi:MAG: pyridoxamine 5'-phosphate oxidase family protein [Prevotellaceae bacterium]|jgi:general stress protein 26|nr:pyridoxamine 5'-phosphate oxidase family protein [Prevotellaceae bacterium]
MTKEEFIKHAGQFIKKCSIVTVASINENGYPRAVPLAKLKSDGIDSIWFSTGAGSAKVKHFKTNAKASASFYNENDNVALTGKMEVLTDNASKKELWQDWMKEHFPGGMEDPEYVVLKFTAEEMTAWINTEFIHTAL